MNNGFGSRDAGECPDVTYPMNLKKSDLQMDATWAFSFMCSSKSTNTFRAVAARWTFILANGDGWFGRIFTDPALYKQEFSLTVIKF